MTGQRSLGTVVGTLALALPRLGQFAWESLPDRLPHFWRTPQSWLTKHGAGQAGFLASNVAYLYAGVRLLQSAAPPVLGALTLVCCAASCGYHGAQCLHGCDSGAAARFCQIDT